MVRTRRTTALAASISAYDMNSKIDTSTIVSAGQETVVSVYINSQNLDAIGSEQPQEKDKGPEGERINNSHKVILFNKNNRAAVYHKQTHQKVGEEQRAQVHAEKPKRRRKRGFGWTRTKTKRKGTRNYIKNEHPRVAKLSIPPPTPPAKEEHDDYLPLGSSAAGYASLRKAAHASQISILSLTEHVAQRSMSLLRGLKRARDEADVADDVKSEGGYSQEIAHHIRRKSKTLKELDESIPESSIRSTNRYARCNSSSMGPSLSIRRERSLAPEPSEGRVMGMWEWG